VNEEVGFWAWRRQWLRSHLARPTSPHRRQTDAKLVVIDGRYTAHNEPTNAELAQPWRALRDAAAVDIISLSNAPGYDDNRVIAEPLLEGSQSNVRIIRLSPGQALPPHRHGSSDLMLFAVEGEAVLETETGTVSFSAGSLAFYRGDEELRVSNQGLSGVTLLAFLAPPFPPRPET